MSLILKAKPVVAKKMAALKSICKELTEKQGRAPKLVVVTVGGDEPHARYLQKKKEACLELGAVFESVNFNHPGLEEFKKKLLEIERDTHCNGLIIQLPIKATWKDSTDLSLLIPPLKDVDGLSQLHQYRLYRGRPSKLFESELILPCTPKGIWELLNYYQIEVKHKQVLVVGRGEITGKPLAQILLHAGATVTIAHSQTLDLTPLVHIADLIVLATGCPGTLQRKHLSAPDSKVLIDVGINITPSDKVIGDCDPEIVHLFRGHTPVPGGVGPMTVVSLMENLMQLTAAQLALTHAKS